MQTCPLHCAEQHATGCESGRCQSEAACMRVCRIPACVQICVGTEAATTAVALPTYSQPLQLLPQRQPAITAAGQLALRQALC